MKTTANGEKGQQSERPDPVEFARVGATLFGPSGEAREVKAEEGEYELILGNKQLLSIFFIVVVLLGVFFTMGYILGRNASAPGQEAAKTPAPQAPAVVDLSGQRPAASGEQPAETPSENKPPENKATDTAAEPPVSRATEPPKATEPEPTPAAKTPPAAVGLTEPAKGTVWFQISAIPENDARILRDLLDKKGFPTVLAPGPDDKVRVLVGPMADAEERATLRQKIEAAGFKPFVRRY